MFYQQLTDFFCRLIDKMEQKNSHAKLQKAQRLTYQEITGAITTCSKAVLQTMLISSPTANKREQGTLNAYRVFQKNNGSRLFSLQ